MPTYEYACKSCGNHLEVVQKFTDDPLTECPSCGGLLRKVFGSVGISFKGSGFYKNDSRQAPKTSSADTGPSEKPKSEPAKADSAKSGDSGSGSTKKTDAKAS